MSTILKALRKLEEETQKGRTGAPLPGPTPEPPPRRSRLPLIALVSSAVLAAGIAGWALWLRSPAPVDTSVLVATETAGRPDAAPSVSTPAPAPPGEAPSAATPTPAPVPSLERPAAGAPPRAVAPPPRPAYGVPEPVGNAPEPPSAAASARDFAAPPPEIPNTPPSPPAATAPEPKRRLTASRPSVPKPFSENDGARNDPPPSPPPSPKRLPAAGDASSTSVRPTPQTGNPAMERPKPSPAFQAEATTSRPRSAEPPPALSLFRKPTPSPAREPVRQPSSASAPAPESEIAAFEPEPEPDTEEGPDESGMISVSEASGTTANTASAADAGIPAAHRNLPVQRAKAIGLEIQALVWSPDPDSRMAVINGAILYRGGSVGEFTLTHIGEDYVVIRKDGKLTRVDFVLQ